MSFFARLFPERAARRSVAELRAWLPEMASAEARAVFEGLLEQIEAMSPAEIRQALREQDDTPRGYVLEGSTAVIPISGVMLPARDAFLDWFGADYTATPEVAAAVRAAEADEKVDAIMFAVDSPGGSVRGVRDLEEAVGAATKPTAAHAVGLMASAALWGVVRADRLTADESAVVGSIGVMATVDDSSEAFKKVGVERHLVATGPLKGQGTPGVPVSKEALAEVRAIVEMHFAPFRAAVSEGRNLTGDALAAVTTGGAWPAARAAELGLVDEVVRTPDSISGLMGSPSNDDAPEAGAQAQEQQMSSIPVTPEAFAALEGKVAELGTRLEATVKERDALAQTVTRLEAKAEADAASLAAVKAAQRKDVIDAAQKAGKVVPATRAAAEKLGEAFGDDVDGFRAAIEAYPVVTASNTEGGTPPEGQSMTPEQVAMADKLGLTREQWLAANKEEVA